MKILALETAADPGSAALWLDGEVRVHYCPLRPSNSETLWLGVEILLNDAGIGFSDIDAIAFGTGPGSFTGLRIACGMAQGLCVARDLPLIGISSLEAMAFLTGAERALVVLDAHMGEVYYGAFEAQKWQGEMSGISGISGIGVCAPEAIPLPVSTRDAPGDWTVAGNGLAAYPILRERLAPFACAYLPELMPSAEGIVSLAAPRLARGERLDPADALPFYVRNKVAKMTVERLAEGGRA